MDKDNLDRTDRSILGDIDPDPASTPRPPKAQEDVAERNDADQSMHGGSQHGDSHHSGSREMTEGVTGGTGTETGGTRNYRQGTGATGGDIGNRPE